jgi:hypothetical protein
VGSNPTLSAFSVCQPVNASAFELASGLSALN